MKIELQEPFKSLWKYGYLVVNYENRLNVSLYNSNSNRTIISYARYLMCCYLGYILSSEYEVDHINDDKTDDRIENLQVLTKDQNMLKEYWRYINTKQVCYGFHCVYCNMQFILTEREVKMKLSANVELAFCSRSCSSSYHVSINKRSITLGISEESIIKIKELRSQNLSSYKISKLTGFSRNTVMKYW